ncbi:MAG: TonB-dependent receptor, partial [Burkholderiales bacterium]
MKNFSVSATAMMLALAPFVATAPAMAQETAIAFDIAAGELGSSLARLGRQAGVILSVDPALVRGKQAGELRGTYRLSEALGILLTSSGLEARSDGRGGYRVVSSSAESNQRARSTVPLPAPIRAEQPDDLTGMDRVVVVGALTDVELTHEDIEFRQTNDLSDLFRQVPSVNVGGSVGIAQKIYVRGLEDSMLNVSVDGAPQRGTLFHHIGRVSIEPELLETVDVQAGAGEATSGFGAIGGAIRFRTRDAIDMLDPGQSFGGIVKAGWFSNDGYKLHGTVYGRLFDDIGVVASYTRVERENMEDGGGDELLGTAATQELGFVKVGGELGGGHRASVSYEQRNEKASFGQRPNWPVVVGDPLFPSEAERQTATFNYGFDAGRGASFESTAYWTESGFIQDRYDRWGLYSADITSVGFDVRGRFQAADHDIVLGAEYRDDIVESRYLADQSIWGPWAWDELVGSFKETGSVAGLYVQDHWQPFDPLRVSFGLRYDSYDLDIVTYANSTQSDGVSFNAGFEYDLTDDITASVSFAEALRGKEIGDAFTLEMRPGRISLQPGLRPEKVDNYEAGLSYDRSGFRASAVYYNMVIEDVILDQIGNGPAPQAPNYHENVGTFRAEGVELRAGYSNGPFSIDGYFNHYRSRLNGNMLEGYEHIGLGNSVGDNFNLTAGYEVTPDIGLEASVTHFADLNDIEVLQRNVEIGWIDSTRFVDKPGYTVVDLFVRWRPL